MKNFGTAYMTHRFAKGGMMKCAHGGPVSCNAGCYADGGEVMKEGMPRDGMLQMEDDNIGMANRKGFANGGMIEDDPYNEFDVSGDLDDEMEDLQPEEEVPSMGAGYENSKDQGMLKKRFMSRILQGVMGLHRG